MLSKTKGKLLLAVISLAATVNIYGCTGSDVADSSNAVTKQGTIDVEKMSVGFPETILQKAVFSFALDDNPISHTGGKNQYMARNKTKDGATLLAQCKNGNCFELQRLYRETPIGKDDAVAVLNKMLPEGSPAQSRVDEKGASEHYYFGEDYFGEIVYTPEKKASSVTVYKLSLMKDAKEGSKEAAADAGKDKKSE